MGFVNIDYPYSKNNFRANVPVIANDHTRKNGAKVVPEKRYNHNHCSDGRFTAGSGVSGVDNGHKGGKIGAEKKTKYAPSPREHQEGITIGPKEFGMLRGICTTDHREMMENGAIFTAALGNYLYKIKSYGEYSFCVLQRIKFTKGRRR